MNSLQGKVAMVTGAGQGLGAAIADVLASEGIYVVCTDIQLDKAQEVANTLKERGCDAEAIKMDVLDQHNIQQVVDEIIERIGRIDILINNAGTDKTVPFEALSIEDWDRIQGVNLRGPFLTIKAVLPHLYAQKEGYIINIASTAAKRAWSNATAYHSSKWGLLGLSHALFTEARAHNVKVSAVVAGGMVTPFIMDRFPDTDPNNLQDPYNVARTILYLLQQPQGTIIPEVTVVPLNETSWP